MAIVRDVASGFSFLECPRWHDGRLWLSDFYTHRVLAVDESGAVETIVEVPGQPSGLGWLPEGQLLVVSMRDRRVLRQEADGTLVEHADLSRLTTGHLNDMLVDDSGRAYVGNFGFDLMAGDPPRTANLVRVDPDGTTSVAAEDLAFPNGMALLDGGATLVVAESFGNRLGGYTVLAGGELAERSDWASFGPAPTGEDLGAILSSVAVVPDGICAAPDGTVWVADADNHRAIRVAEGGKIVDEVGTGELQVYACALGGADGATLFLCAAPSFAEHERRDSREAVLLAAKV
ncbi:MAG TPA: SMP-30/gluconolactonase/LRE family protein [Pseudonocardia sp.]|uniref:SMP-30/gluconolactonase/LRE family protein n=1 Tax=Pseudonocardia sp. TaxID=60912 RepID=UPI002C8CCB04|nr:SMP-30/gluconolactonase/LRE family protein [Pseudonocardia sp.]HTF46136.1 SMP-30/gluconolactonase/LRE family protein [Pseudonocardia sp.]